MFHSTAGETAGPFRRTGTTVERSFPRGKETRKNDFRQNRKSGEGRSIGENNRFAVTVAWNEPPGLRNAGRGRLLENTKNNVALVNVGHIPCIRTVVKVFFFEKTLAAIPSVEGARNRIGVLPEIRGEPAGFP
ncbi:MAG: hypothetical protein LBC14_05975 [Desulfovibrio sp.]|jgi:hypothetical protein|nr:hypothetical protein [Desulfovibrio sp.]